MHKVQTSSVGVVRKFGRGVPAYVSPSSSDRGSELRAPSQSTLRVASKRDVSVTKLNGNNPREPYLDCMVGRKRIPQSIKSLLSHACHIQLNIIVLKNLIAPLG
ncbi:hypothetical protein AVEN_143676-1 [Araneus ventricosus]|uniref:Uncharacterized protein n=1 Tax=Araneus ventricosus TaxID=182803 RepID=A0A4Y2AQB0_ARAVE|nr:hypothetical protein AVEN_143676-1 [Araneus ventricosus]